MVRRRQLHGSFARPLPHPRRGLQQAELRRRGNWRILAGAGRREAAPPRRGALPVAALPAIGALARPGARWRAVCRASCAVAYKQWQRLIQTSLP